MPEMPELHLVAAVAAETIIVLFLTMPEAPEVQAALRLLIQLPAQVQTRTWLPVQQAVP